MNRNRITPLIVSALFFWFSIATAAQQTAAKHNVDDSQPIPPQLLLPDAPKTARTVSCFSSFSRAATMFDVVRKCGVPDEHHGSGIYIFYYRMRDGSIVSIGTADLKRLFDIKQVKNGRSVSLLPTQSEQTRFYKAEHGVAADYLKLAKDGTYRIIDREHMFVAVSEEGRWEQSGDVITFNPQTLLRGGEMESANNQTYQGTEAKYGRWVFIIFEKVTTSEIAVPFADVKEEVDSGPRVIPEHVFFKINSEVFQRETKDAYPFRYVKPERKPK